MRRFPYLILFFSAAMLILGSCRQERKYKIGVSQCSTDDWREKMNAEIRREVMLHPEVEVEIRSAHDDPARQQSDIKYFRDNGFDVILASPIEANALTPIIKETHEMGVPVVVFDRDINGRHYRAFQGADNVHIGREAAKYAAHLVGKGSEVIEIFGRPGSTPAIGRHDGFVSEAEKRGLRVVGSGYGYWEDKTSERVADSLLSLYPQASLIYAHNDRMALAARRVADRKGLHPKIIGIDGAPQIGIRAVRDSLIDATFIYPTEGQRLAQTALKILAGESVDSVLKLPITSAVDLSNADILLVQDQALRDETDKITALQGQVDDYWQRHSLQTALLYSTIAVILLLFGLLFFLLRAFWVKKHYQEELEKKNQQLEQEADKQTLLNEQLNRATQSKLAFFTNVSHDLRTPLTLISEPIDQLSQAKNLDDRQKRLMRLASKNILILKRLINQILDFGKYESGKLECNMQELDAFACLREWGASFSGIARSRQMKYAIEVPETSLPMALDQEKLERVVYNILSNAFKYTPDGGNITLKSYEDDGSLVIKVSDTGYGIAEEDLPRIFDRFFQVEKMQPKGSGIGLALVKAFVEMHGGTLTVQSRVGEGTVFTVRIPITHCEGESSEAPKTLIHQEDVKAELAPIEVQDEGIDPAKPLVLVVDDNADIRLLLDELLGEDYNVINAHDGKQGLHLACKYVPDLVVCDVMMLVMDGMECCRLLKQEVTTSHIPVLMLTACSMDEQRVSGYDSGADGYVAKPFNSGLLKARIRSLIENRKRIKDIYSSQGGISLKGTADSVGKVEGSQGAKPRKTGDVESEFYSRFLEIVRTELSDPNLNVDTLASKMGLGRSQFYRKIKALTNFSPVELLRNLRLKAARDMLTTTDKTVSEIAYAVGFSSPAYFTRCYRETFGETPTSLRERL